MDAELREAIKRTTVNIGGVTDASTRAQDASATAGRAFTLTGSKIKVAGTDAAVGITLTSAGGTVTKITDDLYVVNDPSKVPFIIPANLGNGTYTLKLTTQYGGNSKRLLNSSCSVEKIIYIGTAPAGGGGTSGGPDGDLEENPLG